MEIKRVLENSFDIGSKAKYKVKIFDELIKEMNYIELGIFLVSNIKSIDKIIIIEKKE